MNNIETILKSFRPHLSKFIWRIAATSFILMISISLLFSISKDIQDFADEKTQTSYLRWCETSYKNQDFMDLSNKLYTYNIQGEESAIYYEIIEIYELFYQYSIWQEAYDKEFGDIELAKEKAQKYSKAIKAYSGKVVHNENRELLENFIEQLIF